MAFVRQALAGLRLLVVMTVIVGLLYPAAVTVVAQLVANRQANGSLVTDATGKVVGSSLIGQAFDGAEWFQPRPSASGYAGTTSGGSNLSPVSKAQSDARATREADLKAANPDAVGPVPEDALTASASGLEPYISVAYAAWQVPRVAKARGMSVSDVQTLVAANTDRAVLGFLGQDVVNVTTLNAALSRLVTQ
ncbi:MAG TPA: potassium-transporting ATPase subunit KdpC [Propionibacteriaceae bacterium]|nr:potassium-transporting ATPase subunit KdpC [Propionibacteriaceae bacterium]